MTELAKLVERVREIHAVDQQVHHKQLVDAAIGTADRLEHVIDQALAQDPDALESRDIYRDGANDTDPLYVLLDKDGLQCIVNTELCIYGIRHLIHFTKDGDDTLPQLVAMDLCSRYPEYDVALDKVVSRGFNIRIKPKPVVDPVSLLKRFAMCFNDPHKRK